MKKIVVLSLIFVIFSGFLAINQANAATTTSVKTGTKLVVGKVLGVSDANLARIASPGKANKDVKFAKKMAGKILLRVQGKGEAYYINPKDLKKYYLGQKNNAWKITTKKVVTQSVGIIGNNTLKSIAAQSIAAQKKSASKVAGATKVAFKKQQTGVAPQSISYTPVPSSPKVVIGEEQKKAGSALAPNYIPVLGGGSSWISHPAPEAPRGSGNSATFASPDTSSTSQNPTPVTPPVTTPPVVTPPVVMPPVVTPPVVTPPVVTPPVVIPTVVTPKIPAINVPRVGDKVFAGSALLINWDPKAVISSSGTVVIELSHPSGNDKIIATGIANSGQHIWNVPINETLGTGYVFKIWDTGFYKMQNYQIISNPFPIVVPILSLYSPNGGEEYKYDDVMRIHWLSEGLPSNATISISIIVEGSVNGFEVAKNIENDGMEYWRVPIMMPGRYNVRVACANYSNQSCPAGVQVYSNAAFKIVIPKSKGDVNRDGFVTDADSSLVLQYLVSKATLDQEQKGLADINGDGVVTALDAAYIMAQARLNS